MNNDNDNRREKDRVGGKVLLTGRNITTVVTVDKDNIMIIQGIKKAIHTAVTVDKDNIMIIQGIKKAICAAVTVDKDNIMIIQGIKKKLFVLLLPLIRIILWIRVYKNNIIHPSVTVNNDKFIQGLKR